MCASSEDSAGSDAASEDCSARYTAAELAAIFLNFYTFLTTLHFDPADLRVAPAEGWPHITREGCPDWKSDEVIEVLRRLPYFDRRTCRARIHYKSLLIDYSSREPQHFSEYDFGEEGMEFWDDEDIVDPKYIVSIANGRESLGRWLYLDVISGYLHEDVFAVATLDGKDIQTWFDELTESYRTLQLIPCVGYTTILADDVPERAAGLGAITVEEVCAQTEGWKTALDVNYLRQLYRQHGWPDAFRREDAKTAVDELLRLVWEKRGALWESDEWELD
ncbi:hypothetical protein XA68_11348 [Ophiocordyceps unilateralis]|uniref:Uncharacterized protein n=1 Tax=Ophiocordyceps unilateralis TaxID=268505 RepID=A0A2A9PH23_OPHUN|nr:hypothetical protein XA68_11348 [Ophiocordyceps unilateralis]